MPFYRGLIVIRLTGKKMILIACNSNQIFRHSLPRLLFIQYCYKGTDKAVRFPSTGDFLSNGKKIAYAKEKSLCL
jgi:hypothetical protein